MNGEQGLACDEDQKEQSSAHFRSPFAGRSIDAEG